MANGGCRTTQRQHGGERHVGAVAGRVKGQIMTLFVGAVVGSLVVVVAEMTLYFAEKNDDRP